ncbi:MAG: hypothetical protein Rhirs2KO_31450 [Rhizobiaceae bacterium]
MADKAADIEIVAHHPNQLRGSIDDGNIVLLGRQPFGDAVADLTGPADYDAHWLDPERFELSVQR